MASDAQRIPNRSSDNRRWPAWLSAPVLLGALLYGLLALVYGLLALPFRVYSPWSAGWMAWVFLLLAALWPVAMWRGSISWIEVSPETIRVKHVSRSITLPMQCVIDIEAYRHWQSFLSRARAPAVWVKLRRAKGWPRVLLYLEPEAADRLLYALNGLGKRVWLYY